MLYFGHRLHRFDTLIINLKSLIMHWVLIKERKKSKHFPLVSLNQKAAQTLILYLVSLCLLLFMSTICVWIYACLKAVLWNCPCVFMSKSVSMFLSLTKDFALSFIEQQRKRSYGGGGWGMLYGNLDRIFTKDWNFIDYNWPPWPR